MASGRRNTHDIPDVEQLRAELSREQYKQRYRRVLRSTIYTLVVVAAVAVLISVLFLPVLQIYGTSMTPTLSEGDIVVSVKGADFESGDLIASIWATRSGSSAASQGLASEWISTKREMYT